MAFRIGINGFGRIGRYLVRLLAESEDVQIAAINARASNEDLAHLFKYDSVHGTFKGSVKATEEGILINEKVHIPVTRYAIGEWKWGELGADIVVDTSGTLKKKAGLQQHIDCGAKKVIMGAPVSDADVTIVMGVNQDEYKAAEHHVISAASCTTNCLAPVAKVLNDTFGIVHGLMTTIHSYTMSQRILDGSHKDLRRARAAALSMIPTSTGAAQAVGKVIPELKGRLDGMSVRVPTANVSIVDLTCELQQNTTVEAINAALEQASKTSMKGSLGFSTEPLVSVDYTGDTHGGVVDALTTAVMDQKMAKVLIWYDNEAGFTNQLLRLIRLVGSSL